MQRSPMMMPAQGAKAWSPAQMAARPWMGGPQSAAPMQAMPWRQKAMPTTVPGKQFAPMAAQMPWMAGANIPGPMMGMNVPAGHSMTNVQPLTGGMMMPETQGSFRVPGFSIALDTPLLQGNFSWPGWQGGFDWDGMRSMFNSQGLQFGSMGQDAQALIKWPDLRGIIRPE